MKGGIAPPKAIPREQEYLWGNGDPIDNILIGKFSGNLKEKGDSCPGYPPCDKEYMWKRGGFPLTGIFIGIFEKYFKKDFLQNSLFITSLNPNQKGLP